MASVPRPEQPPYFNISPDAALSDLGGTSGSQDFARIAQACAKGRDDLASRGLQEDGRKTLRLFSTWEITKYLIPVATAHFRRVLKANPDLPQGRSETEGGAKWFTLDEVLRLRAHFSVEGSKAKEYVPYRPKGLPAKLVAVANFKGGVGKTSTCAHLAMSAALDGYKVLVIDLDSQGSMTSIFGGQVADEWQTVFPLLARHYATHLRAENQSRLDRGETPIALDETLSRGFDTDSARSDPENPLAQYRPDRRAAEPLLGRIPDPRLAHAGPNLEAVGCADRPAGGGRHPGSIRPDLPRYPPCPRLSDDQRAGGLRYPAGAPWRIVSGVRFHGSVLRHAALDLPLDRGRREHRRPRPGSARDGVRMGRGACGDHPL